MDTKDNTTKLKEQMSKSLADLQAMRDEIRVNLHLATMDAKDKWKQLEPHLDGVTVFAHDVSQSAQEKVAELMRRARVVRDAVRDSKKS